jgi:galactonate dehydratase
MIAAGVSIVAPALPEKGNMRISQIEPLVFNVSEKTNWFFLRVTADNGLAGVGEASLNGWEPAQVAVANTLGAQWTGEAVDSLLSRLHVYPHSPGGLIGSSIISAMEQALTDLSAKAAGVPAFEWLGRTLPGGVRRRAVPVYANINRGARDRTPDGIAQAARRAVEQGFGGVKIAPFDGVYWGDADAAEITRRTQAGVERVLAIREAVGPDIKVMVDCHWRFDEARAMAVMQALKPARLFWFECPVSENPDAFAMLERIHRATNEAGMQLAGAEHQIGVSGFAPFVAEHRLDVIMPDIKYTGGFGEMLRIAADCENHGAHFSPHNPTGPVCNVASMHLCGVAPAFLILEHQLAESPMYYDLAGGYRPLLKDGCFILPEAPGLGVDLDDAVLKAHPYKPLPPNANLDERLG